MAEFRIKRGAKVYHVREFNSLLQLARRSLLAPEDMIFIPAENQWVQAFTVPDLRRVFDEIALETGIGPDGRPLTVKRRAMLSLPEIPVESIEVLPLDTPAPRSQPQSWEEALDEALRDLEDIAITPPVEVVRPTIPAPLPVLTPLAPTPVVAPPPPPTSPLVATGGWRPAQVTAQMPTLSPTATSGDFGIQRGPLSPEMPGTEPRLTAINTPRDPNLTPPRPPVAGQTRRPPPPRRRPEPQKAAEPESSFSLTRVLLVAGIPISIAMLWMWSIRTTADRQFEPAPPPPTQKVEKQAVPAKLRRTEEQKELLAREEELRAKVPVKLLVSVRDPEEVQDSIFTELLNGGVRPTSVTLEPLSGEFLPHSSLKKVELNVSVKVRGDLDAVDEILAVSSLVVGKYAVRGPMRVSQMIIEVDPGDEIPPSAWSVSGEDLRSFYNRRTSLVDFMALLER